MALFAVVASAVQAQSMGTGTISGIAIDGESGDPVRKAIVTLGLDENPRRWATVRTDGSGNFSFDHLPAGKYDLHATKNSGGTATYGAKDQRELGDTIPLGDGEIRRGVVLRFVHPASLSGHVYDSDGDPFAGARLTLLRQGRNFGAPVLLYYRGAATDDRGEFKFLQVEPGLYYLHVDRLIPGMPSPGSNNVLAEQYYGGAQSSKDATPIHISAGQQLAGFDFHLLPFPAVEVHGRIVDVPSEAGLADGEKPGIEVNVSPVDKDDRWWPIVIASAPEYRFQTPDLLPGQYHLDAVYHSGGKTYVASEMVDLQPGSGDIQLRLSPGVELRGTLQAEGELEKSTHFRIQLLRPGNRGGDAVAEVDSAGHFSFGQISPGEWQLEVNPMPPGFLKSARYGHKDVRFQTFEVGSNKEASLNLVVSMRTASVEGEIDAVSQDAKRAGIVLAPLGAYHNFARFYYGTITDSAGKFKLTGIAPGKYKIFALEKIAPANFRNPEAADQLGDLGETIDIAEGATVQTHPKLIPENRAVKAIE